MRKKRILCDVLNADFYKHYKLTVKSPLDIKVYKAISEDFNRELKDLVIDGFKVRFYKGMSYVSIQERVRIYRLNSVGDPILPVNWSLTNKLNQRDENGKLIRCYLADDPYYYKVVWFNHVPGPTINYKFYPCREFKNTVFKKITSDPLIRLKYRSNTPNKALFKNKRNGKQNNQLQTDNS